MKPLTALLLLSTVTAALADEDLSAVPACPVWPGEGAAVRGASSGSCSLSLDSDKPVPLWRDRITYTVRVVPGILERARWRNNLTYALRDDLTIGIEYNPLASDIHPTLNWRLVDETKTRPSLMLGTSSDRIGTPHGTATYLTIAKSLKPQTGLPIAPYAGINYSSYNNRFSFIGGASIQFSKNVSLMAIYDGVATHGSLSYTTGRHTLSLLAVDVDGKWHAGAGWSVRF